MGDINLDRGSHSSSHPLRKTLTHPKVIPKINCKQFSNTLLKSCKLCQICIRIPKNFPLCWLCESSFVLCRKNIWSMVLICQWTWKKLLFNLLSASNISTFERNSSINHAVYFCIHCKPDHEVHYESLFESFRHHIMTTRKLLDILYVMKARTWSFARNGRMSGLALLLLTFLFLNWSTWSD